ncbi:MAG TPA: S8 family serine peptidase [Solirubrobacterales bacterium]|nr:S8 family serine peptidase [Solirubrobacterales bacterium]
MERDSRIELAMAIVAVALFIVILWFAPSLARAAEGPVDSSAGSRIPHEVLVGFRSGTDSETRQQVLDSAGAEDVNAIPGLPRARRVELEDGQTIDEAIDELEDEDDVAWVQPNIIGHISEIPDDPDFNQLWAYRNTGQTVDGTSGTADADIDADQAWDVSTGGGARIAVVDTGVDATSPDLENEVDTSLSRNFAGSIETGNVDSSDWADQNGHGTHVAGTIAAEGDNGVGVAGTSWDTDLVAVRACDFDGYCDSATVASALAYAGSIGSRAVNVSLGFSGSASDASVIRSAINQYPDTLYIVAAGNDDESVEQTPTWPCSLNLDNVICVAATDQNDKLADFSNWGSTSVDLGAPGVNILSTVPNITAKTDDELTNGLSGWTQGGSGSWNLGSLTNGGSYIKLNATGSTTSATLTTGSLDFSGGQSCSSTYYLSAKLRTGQSLTEQYSTDGGASWQSPGPYGAINSQTGVDDQQFYEMSSWFGAADGEGQVLVRFRYTSTGASSQAPVIDIAYPLVSCIDQQPTAGTYDIYSGTSMATPQVTGAAALLAGYEPDLDAGEVRQALLSSVDDLGSLTGKTVTGGRLNLASTLGAGSDQSSSNSSNSNGSDDGSDGTAGSAAATMRILSVRRMANGKARVKVRVSKAGKVWIKGTRSVAGRTRRVTGATTVTLTVVSRGRIKRRLQKHLRSQVYVTVGYRPNGGTSRLRSRWVTLNRR